MPNHRHQRGLGHLLDPTADPVDLQALGDQTDRTATTEKQAEELARRLRR